MKKTTLFRNLFFLISLLAINNVNAQEKAQAQGRTPNGMIRCSTDEYEALLRAQDPKRMTPEQFSAFVNPLVQQQLIAQQSSSQSGGIIYIPVVVHVIHNGDAYGTGENIADEQVESQITVMNQDYRRLLGTPGYNTNPVGADVQIQFVLAKVDPNGNPTNGIDRVNLCTETYDVGSFAQIQAKINADVKPQTTWDATKYMNMWCVNWDGSGLLGYGQFPSNSTTALSNNTDGVVAGHSYFGSRAIYPAGTYGDTTYDKGRTMTHEVGHFLGLRHIWGDNPDCIADDGIADTPLAATENYGCPTGANSCPAAGNDMIENYMDYTDDACMNIFTNDQKTFMTTVMSSFPRRTSLKTSVADIAIPLFANDAEVKIENSCNNGPTPTCAAPNPTTPAKTVLLYNRGTANLTAATLSYNMNGGTAYTQNWTGNLAPNKYAVVTLTNTTVNGTLNVTITAANGGADQRATNNTASKSFGTPVGYANATTFTFNLFGDTYGTETSWTLKNQAGTTLYFGGPYTDASPAGAQQLVTNQTWTLPANGCYYLTVNDAYGDGLFDGTVQGYYTVTAGATTVVNVPDFVASGNPANTLISRVSYFTNNAALATDSFDLTDITLYPNPSKNFFTIDVPLDIARTGKMEIYNTLGQKVVTKNITSDADLTVNVSSLTNGVYFLNLNLGDATKTLRFIKE